MSWVGGNNALRVVARHVGPEIVARYILILPIALTLWIVQSAPHRNLNGIQGVVVEGNSAYALHVELVEPCCSYSLPLLRVHGYPDHLRTHTRLEAISTGMTLPPSLYLTPLHVRRGHIAALPAV